jgi:hypothetical protein
LFEMALGIFASKGDAQRNSDSSDGNVAKPEKTYDPESGLSDGSRKRHQVPYLQLAKSMLPLWLRQKWLSVLYVQN